MANRVGNITSKTVKDGKDVELENRIDEAFNKINWDIMKKHIHSNDAYQQFDAIKKHVRELFDDIHDLAAYAKEPDPLISYCERLYPKPACNDSTFLKIIQQKLQVKGNNKKIFGMGFALGSALGWSIAWSIASTRYLTNRKDVN